MKAPNWIQGHAIGKIFYYLDENLSVPEFDLAVEDLEAEVKRYETALGRAEKELQELKESTPSGLEESRFLDSHILMLQDPDFNSKVVEGIRKQKKNAEHMLYSTAKEFIQVFKNLKDPYLRERTVDFYDVSRRVLNHLLYRERISLNDLL